MRNSGRCVVQPPDNPLLQETSRAKHMQKHADRTDKRPPIIAGPPGMSQDLHWPKMDPSLYQGYDRLDPYGQSLMDPTRFHQQFAEDLRNQGPYAMGGGGWADPSKASSAFTPLNTGTLATSTGFNMGGGTRGYPFYDPISFQRQSQVGRQSLWTGHSLNKTFYRLDSSRKLPGPTSSLCRKSRTMLTTEAARLHDAWSRPTARPPPPEPTSPARRGRTGWQLAAAGGSGDT